MRIMASPGKLSNRHKKQIPMWKKQGMTNEEIATAIDRTSVAVENYLDSVGYIDADLPPMDADLYKIELALKQKPYWSDLQKQFNKHELDTFKEMWVKMMSEQFRHDLFPAEELQVKQLLTLYIFIDRSAVERQQQTKDISRFQKDLDAEYKLLQNKRDMAKIDYLEGKLAFARSSVNNHTTEHTRLLDKIERINKDLKATRDQRVKRIENAKTSFTGLIRALEDEDYRKRVGVEAELMNMAKEKVKDELTSWHEYGTGTDYVEIDIPLLNADTVMEHDDI